MNKEKLKQLNKLGIREISSDELKELLEEKYLSLYYPGFKMQKKIEVYIGKYKYIRFFKYKGKQKFCMYSENYLNQHTVKELENKIYEFDKEWCDK